ncbi:hypothetical protein PINS_up013580 [Pythium insidiosum]|nr:hypothetical protein PINS_up013580 [Pythium insidiosum]
MKLSLPPSIQELSLAATGLESIPSTLRSIPSLVKLSLASNPLARDAAFLLQEVALLPANMVTLDLSNCQLPRVPPLIGRLSSLRELRLADNPLERVSASSFPPSLLSLSLSRLNSCKLPAGVFPTSLEEFSIVESILTEIPPDLLKNSALRRLTLAFAQLPSSASTSFDSWPALSFANLSGNAFDALTLALPPALQILDLSHNDISAFDATHANHSALETLFLHSNRLLTIPSTVFSLPALRTLYAFYITLIPSLSLLTL